jgi:hypothetical protein
MVERDKVYVIERDLVSFEDGVTGGWFGGVSWSKITHFA